MRTRTVCSALAVLAFAGCGDQEEEPARATAEASSLMVTIYPEGEDTGPIETETVSCTDQPDRCAVPFKEPSPTTACTQIYGGPAVATVKGGVGGKPVDARFSLENGCEIARWEKAAPLLGDPPGAKAP